MKFSTRLHLVLKLSMRGAVPLSAFPICIHGVDSYVCHFIHTHIMRPSQWCLLSTSLLELYLTWLVDPEVFITSIYQASSPKSLSNRRLDITV
jgi:hypothetical protein